MSRRNHMRVRSSLKRSPSRTRQEAARKDIGFPWDAWGYSHTIPFGVSYADADLGRNDWGRAEAYKLVGTVNRCIDLIANTVNSIPWNIVRKQGKEKTIVSSSEEQTPTHPLARAINAVYAEQGIAFMKLLIYSRLQYGETYIEKRVNPFDFNRQLTWLNPFWTEPETSTGAITSYRYGDKNGQHQETLKPWQVAYEHTYNPTDNLRGLSKLDAAMYDINTSRGLKRFIKWTLDNNARPGLIATPKQDPSSPVTPLLSQNKVDMITAQLSDSHIGAHNASRALVLESPFDVVTLEGPELDKYKALIQEYKKEICVVFGVPLSMAGDSSSTSYKDGEDVYDDAYINNTIKPHVKDNQDFINVHLMPFFDATGECVLEYDLSAYEDTTEGDRAKADLIAVQQDKGWMTLADAQRAQGLTVYAEYERMVMINGVLTPLAQIAQLGRTPAPTSDITVTEPSIPQLSAQAGSLAPADATKDVPSVAVMLSLVNNVDLLSLQRDLKAKFADQTIDWNEPDSFHITLVFAPTIDEDALAQLASYVEAYPPPALSLNIGSLATFDNLNEHALHFRIRANTSLREYQSDLYAACESFGIPMSQYSRPLDWKPHITMGYAAQRIPSITFHSTLRVTPSEVQVSVERAEGYEIVARIACESSDTVKTHSHAYVFPKPLPVAEWREKALSELKAWQKHEKAGKSRAFVPVYTAHLTSVAYDPLKCERLTGERMFNALFAAVRHEPFKATLARVERAFAKDIGETRQEFEDEFLLAIADHKDGAISASQLSSVLNAVVDNLGEQAYRDGLEDGGVVDAELDEDDQATIARLTREAKAYISDFIDKFDTYSDVQLDGKPKEWANGTLQKFYQHGIAAADANGMYVWKLGPTETHCSDCARLAGTRQRMKAWIKGGLLPQSQELSCFGLNCLCTLENVRGGARG